MTQFDIKNNHKLESKKDLFWVLVGKMSEGVRFKMQLYANNISFIMSFIIMMVLMNSVIVVHFMRSEQPILVGYTKYYCNERYC